MAWIICAAKNNLHRNHKRSGFISAVMLCLLSKGNTVWPNCFFPESPESIHQKMALVNFSLHTLKSKKQNSVCVSLCFCTSLSWAPQGEQEAPSTSTHCAWPSLCTTKKGSFALLCCAPAHCWNLQGLFGVRRGLLKLFMPTCCRRALRGKVYLLLLNEPKPETVSWKFT